MAPCPGQALSDHRNGFFHFNSQSAFLPRRLPDPERAGLSRCWEVFCAGQDHKHDQGDQVHPVTAPFQGSSCQAGEPARQPDGFCPHPDRKEGTSRTGRKGCGTSPPGPAGPHRTGSQWPVSWAAQGGMKRQPPALRGQGWAASALRAWLALLPRGAGHGRRIKGCSQRSPRHPRC